MTDDKTVIPRLLALRSIKYNSPRRVLPPHPTNSTLPKPTSQQRLINTERRLTPRKVLCQRSYSSRRPVEGKTVTGSSRKVQEQTSVKQLTTTTKRLKPISGDNKEGVAAASVVQHWLRQLVLDIALRGRINAIPAAVRHADNLPGRGDVSQGMVVSSCSELDKVDDTSIVASNSRGNSEGLRLLTKLGGDGLALSVKDKKAVVDRLRRVLDNKKDGVCDDNQPEVLEVLKDTPQKRIIVDKASQEDTRNRDKGKMPDRTPTNRVTRDRSDKMARKRRRNVASSKGGGGVQGRVEREVSLRIPQCTIRNGIRKDEVMVIVKDEIHKVIRGQVTITRVNEVLSYGPTSTSDGSVVITFTLRGYDNNSMKAAIEELEAQVKDEGSTLRTGAISSVLWDKEERYRMYMMCQENGRRHAEIVRRLVDDDDSGICGDEYLKIDTDKHHFILSQGSSKNRVLLPEDSRPPEHNSRVILSRCLKQTYDPW